MFKIFIIIFRESIEITLLLGIILAATRHIEDSRRKVTLGIMLGTCGASILAFCTSAISNAFDGSGQEVFNIIILSITVLMIGSTVIWINNNSVRATLAKINHPHQKESIVSESIIPMMVATSIFREGSEIVLYIYSVLSFEHLSHVNFIMSIMLGAFAGILVGIFLYYGIIKYSGRKLFQVTSWLFIFIAASLSVEIANQINSMGYGLSLSNQLWNSAWIISDNSVIGRILNILIGYNSAPNTLQLIFYFSTIAIIFWLKNNMTAIAQNKIK